MAGLLDFLFGAPAPKQPAYSWMPPEENQAGLLSSNNGQMLGYLAGVLQPGLTQERMARGFAGMLSGQQNDIMNQQRLDALQGQREQKRAVAGALDPLVQSGAVSGANANFLAATPKASEFLSQGMISPKITQLPDGTIIREDTFGRPAIIGHAPISEKTEVTNPDNTKSPAFLIKPSMGNLSGGVTVPTVMGPRGAPLIGMPQIGAITPDMLGNAPPARRVAPNAMPQVDDPTMTVSPSQVARVNGLISEQSPQVQAEGKKTGDLLADSYDAYRKSGISATKKLTTLSRMSQLSDDAYQGAAAPALQHVRSLLTTFGLDPGKVPKGEELTALSNKMVMDGLNGSLGTGVSNADADRVTNMNPNLAQTAAGRKELIATLTALAQREQQVAKAATAWKAKKGTIEGFDSAVADWAEKNPLFPTPTFDDRFAASGGGGNKVPTSSPSGWSITPVK